MCIPNFEDWSWLLGDCQGDLVRTVQEETGKTEADDFLEQLLAPL